MENNIELVCFAIYVRRIYSFTRHVLFLYISEFVFDVYLIIVLIYI